MFTFCLLCTVISLLLPSFIAAQWAPIIKLSTNEVDTGMNENMGQCIVAIQNYVHVVWFDTLSPTDSAIFYKRSTDGGSTWGNDTRISPASVLDGDPLMAACGTYVHIVYWRNPYNSLNNDTGQPPTKSYYIRSADSGVTWQTEVFIGDFTYWPGLACSGNYVYINMNNITTWVPYNTEVFFISSSNNGTTWSGISQISNAVGRSEDPAMSAYGSNVYMAWNDNRLDLKHLQLYFRASNDNGLNWGAETALSALPSVCYSPTVYANGNNAHVFFSNTSGNPILVNYLKSLDGGQTFSNPVPITNISGSKYESAAADQENVHVIFNSGVATDDKSYYVKSSDGGVTWSSAVPIGMWPSSVTYTPASFISVLGNVVYLAWTMLNATGGHHAIYYTYNPTANVQSTNSTSPISGSPTSSGSPVASGSPVTSGSPVVSGSPVTSGSPVATSHLSTPSGASTVHHTFLCLTIVSLVCLVML